MKKKELKNLAVKIAAAEEMLQNSKDQNVIHEAQEEIFKLSSKVHDIEDMMLLDEMIQEILEKNS